MSTDHQLWELLRAIAGGDTAQWPALLAELEPVVAGFARRQPIGRLRDREDTPREIVTRVFARLHARDHAAIQKLCALDPAPELRAWLRVVVRRAAIDYLRESPEFERATNRWVSLATLSSGAPSPARDSLVDKRNDVLAFVRGAVDQARAEHIEHGELAFTRLALTWKVARIHVRRLVTRGEQYLAVLAAVLDGQSYPDIAQRLAITRREVELTVRYIEELLRERGFALAPEA
ncbi:MAG TPA: hypothetical protein VH165_11900 [Kofleriaceae bacterium]|nr:hypothetical protein [Kofleriaceae bacterium]